jgi:Tol biopolymer transport system component
MTVTNGYADWSISALDLGTTHAPVENNILSSSEQDEAPSVSPTGEKLVFQSWRSGAQEIWLSDVAGKNPIQLTNAGASAGSPSWSPDGHWIAFDARPDSFAHIFIMDADGGAPKPLTQGKSNDVVPSWSADGKWIYFGSNRSGSWAIWRLAADGLGVPEQVTISEGMVAKASADGKWLYFTRFAEPGIFRQPIGGDHETKISEGPPADRQDYWAIGAKGIYTLQGNGKGYDVVLLNPDTGDLEVICSLAHSPTLFAGMALEPNDSRLILSEMNRAGSHITLVEHFH